MLKRLINVNLDKQLMQTKKFQEKIRKDWLERDKKAGINALFEHLEEEKNELIEAIKEGNLEHISEEIADVIIITTGIANLQNIDLEKALKTKMKILEKRLEKRRM